MLDAGYRPVGKDFPVFLHPKTHDEYALARTERKSGKGYKGFVVHAAPECDSGSRFSRRDFTMNAIAKDAEGKLIDPFNGQADIQAKILRHVSSAFAEGSRCVSCVRHVFPQDFPSLPLRRKPLRLMREMVDNGRGRCAGARACLARAFERA